LDLNPSWSSLAASATAAATTLSVATGEGAYFNKYDLVKIPATGEVVLVTSVSGDNLTVVRGLTRAIAHVKLHQVLGSLNKSIQSKMGRLDRKGNQQGQNPSETSTCSVKAIVALMKV